MIPKKKNGVIIITRLKKNPNLVPLQSHPNRRIEISRSPLENLKIISTSSDEEDERSKNEENFSVGNFKKTNSKMKFSPLKKSNNSIHNELNSLSNTTTKNRDANEILLEYFPDSYHLKREIEKNKNNPNTSSKSYKSLDDSNILESVKPLDNIFYGSNKIDLQNKTAEKTPNDEIPNSLSNSNKELDSEEEKIQKLFKETVSLYRKKKNKKKSKNLSNDGEKEYKFSDLWRNLIDSSIERRNKKLGLKSSKNDKTLKKKRFKNKLQKMLEEMSDESQDEKETPLPMETEKHERIHVQPIEDEPDEMEHGLSFESIPINMSSEIVIEDFPKKKIEIDKQVMMAKNVNNVKEDPEHFESDGDDSDEEEMIFDNNDPLNDLVVMNDMSLDVNEDNHEVEMVKVDLNSSMKVQEDKSKIRIETPKIEVRGIESEELFESDSEEEVEGELKIEDTHVLSDETSTSIVITKSEPVIINKKLKSREKTKKVNDEENEIEIDLKEKDPIKRNKKIKEKEVIDKSENEKNEFLEDLDVELSNDDTEEEEEEMLKQKEVLSFRKNKHKKKKTVSSPKVIHHNERKNEIIHVSSKEKQKESKINEKVESIIWCISLLSCSLFMIFLINVPAIVGIVFLNFITIYHIILSMLNDVDVDWNTMTFYLINYGVHFVFVMFLMIFNVLMSYKILRKRKVFSVNKKGFSSVIYLTSLVVFQVVIFLILFTSTSGFIILRAFELYNWFNFNSTIQQSYYIYYVAPIEIVFLLICLVVIVYLFWDQCVKKCCCFCFCENRYAHKNRKKRRFGDDNVVKEEIELKDVINVKIE